MNSFSSSSVKQPVLEQIYYSRLMVTFMMLLLPFKVLTATYVGKRGLKLSNDVELILRFSCLSTPVGRSLVSGFKR